MPIPSGLSPGATAQALAASNTVSNAPRGGYLAALGRLGLQPSPAHYTAQGAIEGQVGAGQMTAGQAARLKGRDLTERGFSPMLGFVGAMPYQLFDEAFDPEASGQRSLSDALSQGWQNMRGVGDVVGERIRENPWGALSAIFSSQVTPGGGYTDVSRDPAFDVNERSMASLAPVDRANYERTVREPTWFPPTTESGIGGMVTDPSTIPPVETPEVWRARQESEARAVVETDRVATLDALRGMFGQEPSQAITESPSMAYSQPNVQYALSTALEEAQNNFTSPGGTLAEDRAKYGGIKDYMASIGESGMPRTEEDRHDVREHLDLVFGTWAPRIAGGEPTDPEDPYKRFGLNMATTMVTPLGLIPGVPKMQDVVLDIADNADKVNTMVSDYKDLKEKGEDEEASKEVTRISEALKDFTNNEIFKDIRDSEALEDTDIQTKMDMAYQNPNVVWDERQMQSLAELIATGDKKIEDVLEDDMVELKTQVESFSKFTPPDVESFADMPEPEPLDPQVEDFSAIRDREAEAAAERDREAEEAAAERSRAAEAAAAERDRAAAKAAAERDRERANREREKAERQAEIARDERARASAEQDRLEALSRQRDAERRVAEAERTRQEAEAAEERKRQQQRESAEKRREDLERAAVAQRQAEQERERLKQKNREAAAAANAKWARYNSTSWSRLPGETQLEYTQRMQRLGRGGGMYT